MTDYSKNPFSPKNYLIENKLANEKGEVLFSNIFPRSPTWGLGPYSESKALMYLVTLLHFFDDKCMLDNLNIFTVNDDEDKAAVTIYINEVDRNHDYAHPNLEWDLIVDTVDFLVERMTGAEISRMSKNLFFKDE